MLPSYEVNWLFSDCISNHQYVPVIKTPIYREQNLKQKQFDKLCIPFFFYIFAFIFYFAKCE